MSTQQIFDEISVNQSKTIYDVQSSIGSDLVLFDKFEDVPILSESRRMNGVFVALCLEGSARYTVDTKEQMVRKNDVIIISKGQVVGDYMLSRDCRGLAILASWGFYQEVIRDVKELATLFYLSVNRPVYNLESATVEMFVAYFRQIKQHVDDVEHQYREAVVKMLIRALIYDMGNVIFRIQHRDGAKHQSRSTQVFFDFIALLEQNFRQERRVSWYAGELGLSPKYLSETIKQVSQRTPNEWIDNFVVTELRLLLNNTSKSIKQIAEEMNFANQSFLGKYFKENVGLSPTDYRKT